MKKFIKSKWCIMFTVLTLIGCASDNNNDESNITIPTLSTTTLSSIFGSSAVSGGIIQSDGGSKITVKGICWSPKNSNPTLVDEKTIENTESFDFSSSLIDLKPNTTYYVSSYATNAAGTAYGNPITFKTIGSNLLPSLITTATVKGTTATATIKIISQGSDPIKEIKVVCYNSINWEVGIVKNISRWDPNNPSAPIIFEISGLSLTTNYIVIGYATNSAGTGKSEVYHFGTF